MKRMTTMLSAALILSVYLAGCNFPGVGTSLEPIGQPQTLAAQTIQARLTENASGSGLQTLAPTNTLALLQTNTPAPSNTQGAGYTPVVPATSTSTPCNRARFIEDVTIPDGTTMSPGESFTKTWRLENTGSCTWNANYKLVFDNGDVMGAPAVVDMAAGSVSPGQKVNVSVVFTAPNAPGDYRSDWKLRSDTGEVFGLGNNGTGTFYTEISVASPLSYNLSIVNSHDCSGNLVVALAVENNGSKFLQSGTGVITNVNTSATTYLPPMNAPFVDNPNACGAGNVSDADPGQTYYFLVNLGAPASGVKFQITTSFCTEDGLGGDCLDKTRNFTVP